MPLEESPSLDKYKDGIPEPPQDSSQQQRRVRVLLLASFLVVLMLTFANFLRSPISGQYLGTGTVTGRVFTVNGEPFHGEIVILGVNRSVQTADDGTFLVERVPSGAQSLIILDGKGGTEVRVEVKSGQNQNVGEIIFVGTAMPNQ